MGMKFGTKDQKNLCCCILFSVCAVQVQPNGDNIGIEVYAHNSCSTFASHIGILKKGSISCCQVLNL